MFEPLPHRDQSFHLPSGEHPLLRAVLKFLGHQLDEYFDVLVHPATRNPQRFYNRFPGKLGFNKGASGHNAAPVQTSIA